MSSEDIVDLIISSVTVKGTAHLLSRHIDAFIYANSRHCSISKSLASAQLTVVQFLASVFWGFDGQLAAAAFEFHHV